MRSGESGNRLADEMRRMRGSNARAVIARLNPIIRGWAAYYRGVVSSKVFSALDHYMWWLTFRWARHTHPNKSKKWIARRYFGRFNKFRNDRWVFGARDHVVNDRGDVAYLVKFSWTAIVRHQLVAGGASPDDPDLVDYWAARRRKVKPPLDSYNLRLLAKQDGRCPLCGDHLLDPDQPPQSPHEWERWWLGVVRRAIAADYLTHHGRGGTPDGNRTRLVHTSCHRSLRLGNAGARRHRSPRRPRGLLEPSAGKARSSGSEGAPAQQCAGATRQIESAYLALRHTMLAGHVLRSGDRAGLEQEVWALLTLYQLLRMAMTDRGRDPSRHQPRPGQLHQRPAGRPRPAHRRCRGLPRPRRARRPARGHRPGRAGHAAARPPGPLQRPQGQVRDLPLPQPRRRPPRRTHRRHHDRHPHAHPTARGPHAPNPIPAPPEPTPRSPATDPPRPRHRVLRSYPRRAWSGAELAEKLQIPKHNMLTQLAEWTRLGFLTRTDAGTYTLDPPP